MTHTDLELPIEQSKTGQSPVGKSLPSQSLAWRRPAWAWILLALLPGLALPSYFLIASDFFLGPIAIGCAVCATIACLVCLIDDVEGTNTYGDVVFLFLKAAGWIVLCISLPFGPLFPIVLIFAFPIAVPWSLWVGWLVAVVAFERRDPAIKKPPE
jgi:hypothetical protein